MPNPRYHNKPGRKPTWRVSWKVDGVPRTRRFDTEEEAATFAATLPVKRRSPDAFACDADRISLNVTVDDRGCWNWNLYRHPVEGYGYLTLGRRRMVAHRFSYEAFVGSIPEGLQIDHLCRNRACVNPEHLEPVTCKVNVNRAPWHLAKINGSKTHCVNGHEFTDENTGRDGRYRYRYCRTCARASSRRSRARRAFRAAGIEVAA